MEQQVITLKHLKILLEKQMMSSKEQTERLNNIEPVIWEQDEASEKAGNRQVMTGKEKKMGEQYI